MENSESLDSVYYCVFFEFFLTVKELSTERYFIVWAAKLNQHVYYKGKGILSSKFGSKDMLLWKRDFVSTEDENLWISSRLIWFDEPRVPERSL